MLTRRQLLQQASALSAMLPLFSFCNSIDLTGNKKRFHIGACDWSIGKSSDVGAFALAKEIGLQGLMVNMGSAANNLHLRQTSVQQAFKEASVYTGVKISSIAIGELNNVPYKQDPRTEQWVWDSIDVAKNLDVPVVLLAFFAKNDLRGDEQGIKEVIRRLKGVAPKAEQAGVILGIESYLDAADHLRIIDAVGSKNIQVYYDFRNTADAGFDPVAEFHKLGKDRICELHMKENGMLLGKGTLDWQKIGAAIDESGFYGDGWMQIEWAMPDKADVVDSYKQNFSFLKKHFH